MKGQIEQSFQEESIGRTPAEPLKYAPLLRRHPRIAVILLVTAVAIVGGFGFWRWSVDSELKQAEQAAKRSQWKLARSHLTAYLKQHPQDSTAHFLMAEALVKDDASGTREPVLKAVHHLQQISGGSPLAAKARLQQARLTLLILERPAEAEELLDESLQYDPDSLEANLLMWQLMDLTGRHFRSGDYFWRAYQLSPESERLLRLSDWYLAEFYPELANEDFYRALGVRPVGKIPPSINLLVRFRESEPGAAFVHAALANYYLERGRPNSSLELLKEAPDLPRAMQEPYFVAVLFETLVELGEFEKANSCFRQFPTPHSGYLFRRCEGMFHQYVKHDPQTAVVSYKQALADWPGKFDWGLMMRLSECHRKMGELDEAEAVRARVEYLTKEVLLQEKTSRWRDSLHKLNSPHLAGELRDFYREFELRKEASAWEEIRRLMIRSRADSLGEVSIDSLP